MVDGHGWMNTGKSTHDWNAWDTWEGVERVEEKVLSLVRSLIAIGVGIGIGIGISIVRGLELNQIYPIPLADLV